VSRRERIKTAGVNSQASLGVHKQKNTGRFAAAANKESGQNNKANLIF